jgi:hypothetical protein
VTALKPQADAETYGPQLPDMHDLHLAQGRTVDSASLVASDAEYAQRVLERQQTEAAYLTRYDGDLVRELDAGAGQPGMEPAAIDLESAAEAGIEVEL